MPSIKLETVSLLSSSISFSFSFSLPSYYSPSQFFPSIQTSIHSSVLPSIQTPSLPASLPLGTQGLLLGGGSRVLTEGRPDSGLHRAGRLPHTARPLSRLRCLSLEPWKPSGLKQLEYSDPERARTPSLGSSQPAFQIPDPPPHRFRFETTSTPHYCRIRILNGQPKCADFPLTKASWPAAEDQ